MSAADLATSALCECDFDPEYHRDRNQRLGRTGDACGNPAADHGNVVASPALCMACLFGCTP